MPSPSLLKVTLNSKKFSVLVAGGMFTGGVPLIAVTANPAPFTTGP